MARMSWRGHAQAVIVLAVAILAGGGGMLVSCGGGGGSSPTGQGQSPTVAIAASASSVFAGQSIVLSWSSSGATSCTASGAWSGAQALSGRAEVAATDAGSQLYTLTCASGTAQASDTADVVVTTPHFSVNSTFTALPRTLSTSEGSPVGVSDFWTGTDVLTTNLGYGPAGIQRVEICLAAMVSLVNCYGQPQVTAPLSDAMLAALDRGFARFAGSGKRLLVRFVYNDGPIGPGGRDVPAALILTHIGQLAPVVAKYQDLIFALEAGFIGTWGEWHDSTSGNDNPAARKAVLDAEFAAFGGKFPILVRSPQMLIDYLGSTTPSAAFGLHDDFFLSSDDDAGTWTSSGAGGNYSRATLQDFAAAVSSTSAFVGEFGALDSALQTCSNLDAYALRYNLQAISLNIDPPSVASLLVAQGCGLSFLNKVGTRIEIGQAAILGGTAAGTNLHLALTLSNTGYGRVLRARPASVVLRDGSNSLASIPIPLDSLDLRTLQPGAPPTTFQVDVSLPVDISAAVAAGTLGVALSVPDPAASLAPLPAYALPLDSADAGGAQIFDPASGLNLLGRAVGQP